MAMQRSADGFFGISFLRPPAARVCSGAREPTDNNGTRLNQIARLLRNCEIRQKMADYRAG